MKKIIYYIIPVLLMASISSCKKNYAIDGGKSNPNVNMTTYDYLKSKSIFSSLVYLIDRAGLKDSINADITFFATTNYGVDEYLKAMKNKRAIELNNENITYTLDSIPLKNLDSLKTYIFHGKINRDVMTQKGKYYANEFGAIPDVQYMISLTRSYSYSAYVDYVDYVVYTKVIGTKDADELDQKLIPPDQVDKSVLCQTSGIVTTNGILHVLDGYHRLFFNNDPIN
jgi:uncharacterized protein YxeA